MSAGKESSLKLLTSSAGQRTLLPDYSWETGHSDAYSQVWHIDCGSDRAGNVVSEQTGVAKLPSEQITDEEYRDGRR
jgi:hypothetical protein